MASAHARLLELQRRIFKSLREEATRLIGPTPDSIRKYEREFRRDFAGLPARLRHCDKAALIHAIHSADVTFIADYHPFPQAQRTALRLMREAIASPEDWLIGLEMIPSQYQAELDRFQLGKLTAEKFRERIRYEDTWGFPWENYAPIFAWARETGVRLIALNRPPGLAIHSRRRRHFDLYERDQWAAGIITDLFTARPGSRRRLRMIALYGEMHVARDHLPRELARVSGPFLRQPLRAITIHQNQADLYWRLAAHARELDAAAIQLKRGVFCAMSSTPWAKLQSLIDWAESAPESADYDDYELETDHLSRLRSYGTAIAEFLGVEPPSYASLTVKTIAEADFIEGFARDSQFTRAEFRLIRRQVLDNQRLYIPRAGIAYLGSPSPNGAAELAAIHLLRARTGSHAIFTREPDDFYRLTLEAAFGFLGSLIINPRRKCDLPPDHAKRLRELARGERALFRYEREARTLVLELLRRPGKPSALLGPIMEDSRMATAAWAAAGFLGQILARKLHQAIMADDVRIEAARRIFLSTPPLGQSIHYRERYLRLVELAAASASPWHREATSSKADLL